MRLTPRSIWPPSLRLWLPKAVAGAHGVALLCRVSQKLLLLHLGVRLCTDKHGMNKNEKMTCCFKI